MGLLGVTTRSVDPGLTHTIRGGAKWAQDGSARVETKRKQSRAWSQVLGFRLLPAFMIPFSHRPSYATNERDTRPDRPTVPNPRALYPHPLHTINQQNSQSPPPSIHKTKRKCLPKPPPPPSPKLLGRRRRVGALALGGQARVAQQRVRPGLPPAELFCFICSVIVVVIGQKTWARPCVCIHTRSAHPSIDPPPQTKR